MLSKNCTECDKPYLVKPYRFISAKFCSATCYGLSERGRIPKSAFKKGIHPSPQTEFKPGKRHPFFGKSSPALGKRWGLSGQGRKTARLRIMATSEYRSWRKAIFKRDNFTCQICFIRGGKIQADHIKPFYLFPELVFSLNNGRTLCVPCHRKTSTWGRPSRKASQ